MKYLVSCSLLFIFTITLQAQPLILQPNQPQIGGNGIKNVRVVRQNPEGTEVVLAMDYTYDGFGGLTALVLPVIEKKDQKGIGHWFGLDPVTIGVGRGPVSVKVRFFNDEPGVPEKFTTDRIRMLILDSNGRSVISGNNALIKINWGGTRSISQSSVATTPVKPVDNPAVAANEKVRQATEEAELARLKMEAEARSAQQAAARAKAQVEAKEKAMAAAEAEAKKLAKEKQMAEEKARLEAEARQQDKIQAEADEQKRREAEIQARAEAESKEKARLAAQAEARRLELEKNKAEEQGRKSSEDRELARLKAEAEERLRLQEEAAARTAAEARLKFEAERRTQIAAENSSKAPVADPAKAKADLEAESKRIAEARSLAEEKEKREGEERRLARLKADSEEKTRRDAEARARAETEEREKARIAAQEQARKLGEEKLQAEIKARQEAELREQARIRAAAESQARLEAETKARAEAEEKDKARLKAEAEVARLAQEKRVAEDAAVRDAALREENRRRAEADLLAKKQAEVELLAQEQNKSAVVAKPSEPVMARAPESGAVPIQIATHLKTKITNVDVVNRSFDRSQMTFGVEFDYKDKLSKPNLGVSVTRLDQPEVGRFFNSSPLEIGRRNFLLLPVKFTPPPDEEYFSFSTDKVLVYLTDGSAEKMTLFPATMLLSWKSPHATGAAAVKPRDDSNLVFEDFKQTDPHSGYVTVKYNLPAEKGILRARILSASDPKISSFFEVQEKEMKGGRGVDIIPISVLADATFTSPSIHADTIEVELLDGKRNVVGKFTKKADMTWVKKPQ